MSELESSGGLVVIHENRALTRAQLHLADVDGRKEVLEGDGGELLVRSVAKIVEDDEGRGEKGVWRGTRVLLRRRDLSREGVLVNSERQRGASRGAADLHVLASVGGGENEEVRDAEGDQRLARNL